jgi:hypothetical protein
MSRLVHNGSSVVIPIEARNLAVRLLRDIIPRNDICYVFNGKTLSIKSLLTSLCQREAMFPSLEKRGKGRFFNNDFLHTNFLMRQVH